MIVYVVFATGYIEEYYRTEDFVDIFSTSEKAQAYIDSVIHQRKLVCRRLQLEQAFAEAWEEKNPAPYQNIRETKPRYNQALHGDKEYNRQHEGRVLEWRATVERPYQDRLSEHMNAKTAAIREYMATIDLEQQDLSNVDLAYYGQEDNLTIRPIEVK